jgi:1-acyl-sn-glycerol-3-phosphate acyltransferase
MCFKGMTESRDEEHDEDNEISYIDNFFIQTVNVFFEKIKLVFILFAVITNVIQYYIFDKETSTAIMNFLLTNIILRIANIKTKTHGNIHYLNDSNMLIMSNHYEGLDGLIFFSIMNKPSNNLYSVVKSDLVGNEVDKNAISCILSFIKKAFMESSNLISYKRGDKQSGEDVKDAIMEKITSFNSNILVFPEGTTHKCGISKEFKNGIFHLASDENIEILPITLVYDRNDFGSERGDAVNFLSWMNSTCNVYVHEKIRGKNWEELKQKTFNAINDSHIKNSHIKNE